jgi:hypothetical protein
MGKITTKGTGDYHDVIEQLLRKIEGNYRTHKSTNTVGSLLLSAVSASSKDLIILPMASYLGQGAKQCRAIEEPKDKLKSAPKGIGGKDRTDRRDIWYVGRQDDSKTDDYDARYTPHGPDEVAEGGDSDAELYFMSSGGVVVNRLVQVRELASRLTRFCFTSWSTSCAICRVFHILINKKK